MWEKGHFYPSLGKQKKNYTNNNNSKDDYKVHKINFRYLSLPLIKTLPSPHIKKKLLSVQIVCLYPLFYFWEMTLQTSEVHKSNSVVPLFNLTHTHRPIGESVPLAFKGHVLETQHFNAFEYLQNTKTTIETLLLHTCIRTLTSIFYFLGLWLIMTIDGSGWTPWL